MKKAPLLERLSLKGYCFIRPIISSILYFILIKLRFFNVPKKDIETLLKKDEDEFSVILSQYSYKSDPLGGALDFTLLNPKYFFYEDLPYGRDCDDTSFLWFLWAKKRNFNTWQLAVIPDKEFTKSHVITVIQKDDSFYIWDFWLSFKGKSFEDVLNTYFEKRYDDRYSYLNWAIMKKFKRK